MESSTIDEKVNEGLLTHEEMEAKKERDELRYIRKREIERQKRLEEAGKKNSKVARDLERDVTERIVLGQAQPTANENLFDQRLFNQTAGMDGVILLKQGYGSEDEYRVYDKPLFTDRAAASIYKNLNEIPVEEEESKEFF